MKELYNEYFHIPKHGKIRDKVMLIRTAITTIVMIVCLVAMSLTAYAYFSYNVTSGSNIIKAANFDAQITIKEGTYNIDLTTEGEYRVAALEKGKTYTVTLAPPTDDGSAETGFCVITDAFRSKTYHTQQLGVDKNVEGEYTPSITFTLTVSENVKVYILSHWGTSTNYDPYKTDSTNEELYIRDEDPVHITVVNPANGISESDEEKETTSDETTATETIPTEVIHTVAVGENLTEIADFYNTTVARIAAYNKITDPNNIYEGQKLVIPPADYEIPADTTEQTTTPPETTVPETTTTPETTTPETTTSADTTMPPETSVTDPVDTTTPAETTTSTETTGTPETSAPAETTEPVETTSDETEATETTAASTDNAE